MGSIIRPPRWRSLFAPREQATKERRRERALVSLLVTTLALVGAAASNVFGVTVVLLTYLFAPMLFLFTWVRGVGTLPQLEAGSAPSGTVVGTRSAMMLKRSRSRMHTGLSVALMIAGSLLVMAASLSTYLLLPMIVLAGGCAAGLHAISSDTEQHRVRFGLDGVQLPSGSFFSWPKITIEKTLWPTHDIVRIAGAEAPYDKLAVRTSEADRMRTSMRDAEPGASASDRTRAFLDRYTNVRDELPARFANLPAYRSAHLPTTEEFVRVATNLDEDHERAALAFFAIGLRNEPNTVSLVTKHAERLARTGETERLLAALSDGIKLAPLPAAGSAPRGS